MYVGLCGKIYDTHYFQFLLTLCMDNIRACATYDGNLSKTIIGGEIAHLEWEGVCYLSWCFLEHSWVAFKAIATWLWNWVTTLYQVALKIPIYKQNYIDLQKKINGFITIENVCPHVEWWSKGEPLPGGLIHPSIDIEVSLLLTTDLETYPTLFEQTSTWLEWESLPLFWLHMKYIFRNVWALPINPWFDWQVDEATNMRCCWMGVDL